MKAETRPKPRPGAELEDLQRPTPDEALPVLLDRDGFLKLYRRGAAKLQKRLGQQRFAAWTLALLALAADHRTGFVKGSLREIARGIEIPWRTFLDHLMALQRIGEIEVRRAANQHADSAGILVTNYGELRTESAGAKCAPAQKPAGANPAHAGVNPAQQTGSDLQTQAPKKGRNSDALSEPRSPAVRSTSAGLVRDALIAAFDLAPHDITAPMSGKLTKAANQIDGVGGQAGEVAVRLVRFKRRFPSRQHTPTDLSLWWASLHSDADA